MTFNSVAVVAPVVGVLDRQDYIVPSEAMRRKAASRHAWWGWKLTGLDQHSSRYPTEVMGKFRIFHTTYRDSGSGFGGYTDKGVVLDTDDVHKFLTSVVTWNADVQANNRRWNADHQSLRFEAVDSYRCQKCDMPLELRLQDESNAQHVIDVVKAHEHVKTTHDHEAYLRERLAFYQALLTSLME